MSRLDDIREVVKVLAASLGMFAIGVGVGGRITAARVASEFCDFENALYGLTCVDRVYGMMGMVGDPAIWLGLAGWLLAGVLAASEDYGLEDAREVFKNAN